MSVQESSIEEMADVLAIQKLMGRYNRYWDEGHHIDDYDVEPLVSLFHDDCRADWGPLGTVEGKEELREGAKADLGGETAKQDSFHAFMNPWIEVNGDEATGKFHFLGAYVMDDIGATWLFGMYDIDFVKEGDEWKILDLVLDFKWITSHEEGWVEEPMVL
jgi:hypothetical protein